MRFVILYRVQELLNVISSVRRWIIISFTIGKRIELKLGTRLNINLRFFESRFLFVARIRRRYFRMLFFYSRVNTMLCTSIDFSNDF